MAMVLHAYASLSFTPHELLDAAAEHMALHLPEYDAQASRRRCVAVLSMRVLGGGKHGLERSPAARS